MIVFIVCEISTSKPYILRRTQMHICQNLSTFTVQTNQTKYHTQHFEKNADNFTGKRDRKNTMDMYYLYSAAIFNRLLFSCVSDFSVFLFHREQVCFYHLAQYMVHAFSHRSIESKYI